MSIIRPPGDGSDREGHSGRKFLNPKHEEMLEAVMKQRPGMN